MAIGLRRDNARITLWRVAYGGGGGPRRHEQLGSLPLEKWRSALRGIGLDAEERRSVERRIRDRHAAWLEERRDELEDAALRALERGIEAVRTGLTGRSEQVSAPVWEALHAAQAAAHVLRAAPRQ